MLASCRITIEGKNNNNVYMCYSDAMSVSRQFNSLMFLSVLMRGDDARTIAHLFNALDIIHVAGNGQRVGFSKREMDMQSYRGRDGYTHLVFSRKSTLDSDDFDKIVGIYNDFNMGDFDFENRSSAVDDIPKSVSDSVYKAIVDNTSVPILEEWSEYITREAIRKHCMYFATRFNSQEEVYENYHFRTIIAFRVQESDIRKWISEGLKSGYIDIDGCSETSKELLTVTGIDSYQAVFGQVLADRAQREFKPLFNPSTMDYDKRVDGFFDVATYYSDVFTPYRKQKEVIQAAAASLDRQKNVIISGATGSGKTIMSIGTVVSHARKGNYSVLVMVPSKTIGEWVQTIQGVNPLADVRVVENLGDFIEATKYIKSPLRLRPLWIVMSENTIKMNYEERPAVIWDSHDGCYRCPNCGRRIVTVEKRELNGAESNQHHAASHRDFLSKNNRNAVCKTVLDEQGYSLTGCGTHLWTVARRIKEEPEDIVAKNGWARELDWVKVERLGWIHRKNIQQFKNEIEVAMDNIAREAPRSWGDSLSRYLKAIADYESRGTSGGYLYRYSIAHYIRKHLNHVFDYLIADEVHQLASDSKRGEAFGTVIGACWKSVCLTGTLSNGYAKGLFHLLFRTQTRKMLEQGYKHDDITKFNNDYGVVDVIETVTGVLTPTRRGQDFTPKKRKRERKEKPGISQVLVADFLVNNLVVVKKEDIRHDLCKYTETPVPVEMDEELATSYRSLLDTVTTTVTTATGGSRAQTRRAVKNAVLTANMFLDQPFGLDTRRIDNGKEVSLSADVIRNKESKLIEIAKKHKDNGEKMLIYVEFTQALNISARLSKLLTDEGVNTIVMPKMATTKRQKWLTNLAKEGEVDAVIMNPAEVDVGVNLLDYTTIIFYETGTELTKIRQASQRSNRINQEHPVSVYFMYYQDSIQEDILGAISQKLTASKSIEGDFSESALQAMTEDTDITMKIAKSIVNNEHIKVDTDSFALTAANESNEDDTDSEAVKNQVLDLAKNRLQFSSRPKIHFMQIPVENCVSLIV